MSRTEFFARRRVYPVKLAAGLTGCILRNAVLEQLELYTEKS